MMAFEFLYSVLQRIYAPQQLGDVRLIRKRRVCRHGRTQGAGQLPSAQQDRLPCQAMNSPCCTHSIDPTRMDYTGSDLIHVPALPDEPHVLASMRGVPICSPDTLRTPE